MTLQESPPPVHASFSTVFAAALRGRPCSVVGLAGGPQQLPVGAWAREADEADLALLALCRGRTVDLGCGPGRLSAALARRGHVVLGVDVVREAVDQTLARGVAALHGDVFDRLPAEGLWDSALLADGNVGIGGDPLALLRRSRALVSPVGRVVVEVAAPGVPADTVWAALSCDGLRSARFRWSTVGVDDVGRLAEGAGFGRVELHQVAAERWCAVLHGPGGRGGPA